VRGGQKINLELGSRHRKPSTPRHGEKLKEGNLIENRILEKREAIHCLNNLT